jgi:hypothetical protein
MTNAARDLEKLMEPIARTLLGEPNQRLSSKTELRFGARGSMSIDLCKGTWFDHERNTLRSAWTRWTGAQRGGHL